MHKTSKNNIELGKRASRRLELALQVIKAYFRDNLIEVSLFGSYAKGKQHKYSSLDLLIIVSKIDQRFIDRTVEIEKLLNKDDELPLIDPLVYTEDELLDLINKKESFIVSVIEESIVIWNGFNEIDIDKLSGDNTIPSRYKGSLPKLEKIYC